MTLQRYFFLIGFSNLRYIYFQTNTLAKRIFFFLIPAGYG